jgi:acetamidase/formamidase
MTLEVRVLSLRVGRWGWTSAGGYPSHWNVKLGIDTPPHVHSPWALDPDTLTGRDPRGRTVALRPFLGIMGMPPDEPGRHSTTPPRSSGGNIDCKELDGHAVQGDGEVAGPALECPFEAAELEFHLRPDLRLARPRANTPRGWVTFGFHESLDEATVFALSDMLDLLNEQLGCGRREALALASLVVDLHVTQIVNGARGVHAMLAHEALAKLVTR